MHIFEFNASSTGKAEYEEFMLMGAPPEFLDMLLARNAAASYIYIDDQGNHQLDGIGFYEFLGMGGNPDDLAPNFETQQTEQAVMQDVFLPVG